MGSVNFWIVCVIAHCERETLLSISSTDNLGCESIYGQYTVISTAGVDWKGAQSFFSIKQQTLSRSSLFGLEAKDTPYRTLGYFHQGDLIGCGQHPSWA